MTWMHCAIPLKFLFLETPFPCLIALLNECILWFFQSCLPPILIAVACNVSAVHICVGMKCLFTNGIQ